MAKITGHLGIGRKGKRPVVDHLKVLGQERLSFAFKSGIVIIKYQEFI
jgi:hypothetical protein